MTSANHDNTINSSGLTGFCLSDCLSVSASVWLAVNNILLYTDLSIFLFIFRCNYSPIQCVNKCVTYLFTHFNAILDLFHGLSAGLPLKIYTFFLLVLVSPLLFVWYVSAHLFLSISLMCYLHLFERMRGQNASPAKSIGLMMSKVRSREYVRINHSCFIFISC